MRPDIAPGGTFPDYELPDHTNVPRRLSELQGDDPLILTLARGHYCPKEHQQHLELAAFYPKVAVAYTQMATIATDDHHALQEFRASVGAQWPFLSDPGRIVQKDLDIQEYTDPEHDPMIPHTLVLKPGLVIHSIYNGYWFWGRPSVVTSGTTCGRHARDPPRLGPQHARPPRGLGRGRPRRPSMAGTGGPQQARAPPDVVARTICAAPRQPAPGTRPRPGRRFSMNEATARAMIQAHFDASNVGAAGGGPGDDIVRASEIYADDAVVEWPQGGERLRGKANIIAFRSTYPARQQFELHRTTGCHDLWVNEYTIRYDDQPVMVVGIMEFRDEKVVRERIYFGDPWEPPAWRAQWVERFDPWEPDSSA